MSPRIPIWVAVLPYFLSASLFISGILAPFAPLPILFLFFRSARRWAWLAALTNAALVGATLGAGSLGLYLVFGVAMALSLAEWIHARRTMEQAVALTLGVMLIVSAAWMLGYAHHHHLNAWVETKTQLRFWVDYLSKATQQGSGISEAERETWKAGVLLEFPSAVVIFTLAMVWTNLVILLRVNPSGIRQRLGLEPGFLKFWRSPEWLVWPTILTGFLVLVDLGRTSDIALNAFKVFLAIYVIQGLSILSFFLDVWKVQGFLRTVAFVVSIFFMMPLLLSLGFFDLWFDFRSKFRQS